MLLPVGLDESRLARIPWVSIGIAALCILVWLVPVVNGSSRAAESQLREAIGYWREHPYLELPESAQRLTRMDVDKVRPALQRRSKAPPAAFLALEQEELGRRVGDALEAWEARPERRYALVPARGFAQPGWLTHLFLHGGLGHLVGNLLVFILVVGPFLEDAWGRPFFLAFYLLGGIVAGAAQALPMGDSPIAIVGASGAISACLGAFAWRFAHRRVRIFYWLFLFVRGTFHLPVWLYALGGAALDLVGLKAGGVEGSVAYAAHVGGFAFGLAVAAIVRFAHLEERFGPEGATRWAGSMGAARAADALADGRTAEARSHLAEVVSQRPDDDEALVGLARIDFSHHDVTAAHASLERLLSRQLAAGNAVGAAAILAEFEAGLRPELLRQATAYRAAELLEAHEPRRAGSFLEAASAAGGALGAKALVRLARLVRASDPSRAAELAQRVRDAVDAPQELRRAAAELLPGPPPVPSTPPAAGAAPRRAWLGAAEAVRIVPCRLEGATAANLDLIDEGGRRARVAVDRVEVVTVGLVERAPEGASGVLADLLLRGRTAQGRLLLRLSGRAMPLSALRPGLDPAAAFAAFMQDLLTASAATAVPGPAAAMGRPFARFRDLAAFEEACYGRPLASGGPQ